MYVPLMEPLFLWTLTSAVVFNAWNVHGILPVPVLQFQDNIIEDDDTLITCTLPNIIDLDVQLFIKQGNTSLTNCEQRKGNYPNVTCTLEVTREMHEMEFICVAQFKSQSKPAKMMLQTEPEFVDCPGNVVWIEGQETSFHCKAKGYPPPIVTCELNKRVHKEGEKFTPTKNMSGNYKCIAKNRDVVNKIVSVSVEYKPKILNIDVNPPLHGEGATVNLTCDADALPDPIYSWNVPSPTVTYSSDNKTITVQSLEKSQLGKYTCTAHNQHGSASMGAVIDLAVIPKIINITAQPSMQVLEGQNVTLTCEASGFPPPVFKWDTPSRAVEYSHDGSTVTIWGVTKSHMGKYQCKAQNAHGEDTQAQQLTLAVKAMVVKIKVQPSPSVEEGTNVTLTCVADGVPPPKLSWVPQTSNVHYSSDNSVLSIWNAQKIHDGNYKCIAQNKHGEHNLTQTISVKSSAKGSTVGNRGERREFVFATILATLISSLFYDLC